MTPTEQALAALYEEQPNDPGVLAQRFGISWEDLMAACGASEGGHEFEDYDQGDGLWAQSWRGCLFCGAPDSDDGEP